MVQWQRRLTCVAGEVEQLDSVEVEVEEEVEKAFDSHMKEEPELQEDEEEKDFATELECLHLLHNSGFVFLCPCASFFQ